MPRNSLWASEFGQVKGAFVQEIKFLVRLLLLLVENREAAEYLLDGLSSATDQAVRGIYMVELKSVAVSVGCFKASSVDPRLQLSRKVIWMSLLQISINGI